jgi:hypothetical protein
MWVVGKSRDRAAVEPHAVLFILKTERRVRDRRKQVETGML